MCIKKSMMDSHGNEDGQDICEHPDHLCSIDCYLPYTKVSFVRYNDVSVVMHLY
jgi:hypothetical protein